MVKAERGLQAVKCIVRSRKDRCEHLWRSVFINLICASSSCHSTGATSLGRTNLPIVLLGNVAVVAVADGLGHRKTMAR